MILIFKAYLNFDNINGMYFNNCLLHYFSCEPPCSLNPCICMTTPFFNEQQTELIRIYHKTSQSNVFS